MRNDVALSIAKAVRDVAADPETEELQFRVVADMPTHQLQAAVQHAVNRFENDWERDSPLRDSDGPVPPPDFAVTSAAPDVLVSLVKNTDLALTFDRVVDALRIELAAVTLKARLDLPKRSRVPNEVPVAMLHLRIALRGTWSSTATFDIDTDIDLDDVQAGCIAWAREINPTGQMHAQDPKGRFSPIAVGSELEALQETRQDPMSCLVSLFGDNFRSVGGWLTFGWISIVSGTRSVDTFDWREHWAAIEPLFRSLEPHAHAAIVCRSHYLTCSGAGTHTYRALGEAPQRLHADTAHIGRRLEDRSLVDAEGRFFVTDPPDDLPATWTQAPYGHLTQVDAPNIDAWLAQPPSAETLKSGRQALAPLLYR